MFFFLLTNKLPSFTEPPLKKRPKDDQQQHISLKTHVSRPNTDLLQPQLPSNNSVLHNPTPTSVVNALPPTLVAPAPFVAKDEKETKPLSNHQQQPQLTFDTNKPISAIQPQPPMNFDSTMPELKAMAPKEAKPKFPETVAPEIETTKPIVNPPVTSFDNSSSFPLPNVMNAQQQIQPQISNVNINNNNTTSTISSNGGNTIATNPFMDPLEHSLASLESSHEKQPTVDDLLRDMQKHHPSLVQLGANQMNVPHIPPQQPQQPQQQSQQQQISHNAALNHLVSEFNGINGGNAMNGIMNILGMPTDPSNFVNHQMKGAWGNSMQVPPLQGMSLLNTEAANVAVSQSAVNFSQKNEKVLLTPKPIAELLPKSESKMMATSEAHVSYAFGQTFKYEQNIKNAWSQLASAEAAAASQIGGNKSRLPSDTFQEFRTKAKEQQQRQKQEQEKIKMQKEQEFKRQQDLFNKQGKSEDVASAQR